MKKPFYVSLKPLLDYTGLPRPCVWPEVFGNTQKIHVEIGVGNGEYLAGLCAQEHGINFVGFEQYCARIHKALRKLSRVPSAQVRLLRLDAKAGLERLFAPRSIAKVFCLYPPPWPKKSDAKHRMFTTDFLRTINNRLEDDGHFLLVSDWKPYIQWISEQVLGSGFALKVETIKPSYGTKFENKWVEAGQREFYEMRLTKTEHLDVPVKEDEPLQTYVVERFYPETFSLTEVSEDNLAVALKEFIFDDQRHVGLVYAIVSDEGFTQHVRIEIRKVPKGWRIALAQGGLGMPTQGVARALLLVRDLIQLRQDG